MKNRQKIVGSIGIFVILLICMIVGYNISKPKEVRMKEMFVDGKNSIPINKGKNIKTKSNKKTSIKEMNTSSKNKSEEKVIKVCISGEVKHPDMYSLKSGSRIKNLLEVCGGVLPEAELSSINLAQKIKDEDYVYIPKKGENKSINVKDNKEKSNQSMNNVKTSNHALKHNKGKININEANKAELMSIVGIGKVKAEKIIAYREQNGDFKSIEELKDIGARIGDKTLEKIKDYIDIK